MKPTHFTNELLLVFEKKHVIYNQTNLASKTLFTKKKLIFSKTVD